MKQIFIVAIILLTFSQTAYAKKRYYKKRKVKKYTFVEPLKKKPIKKIRNIKNNKDKKVKDEKKKYSMVFGLSGGAGISYPTGDITGNGDQKAKVDLGYYFGIDYTYLITDWGGPLAGISYANNKNKIERSYFTSKMKNTITAEFIHLNAGYKFLINFFYVNTGLYYGMKTGAWTEKVELNGESENNIDSAFRKDEFGFFLQAGVDINIYKSIFIDIGIKYEMAFSNFYENEDKLRSNTAGFVLGVNYKI